MTRITKIAEPLRDQMTRLARLIDKAFNPEYFSSQKRIGRKHGFVLLVFDFGEKGRMNYMSNAERNEMIVAMKEFIAVHEARVSEQTGRA